MFLSTAVFFNVIAILVLTIGILSCILLVKVPMRYGVKFALIPVVISFAYILIVSGEQVLGRPYEIMPQGTFEFYSYRVVVDNGVKKIELWVIQDKKTRLHLIPYSAKTEQEMAKAKSRKNKGAQGQGKFTRKEGVAEYDLLIEDRPPEQLFTPKE